MPKFRVGRQKEAPKGATFHTDIERELGNAARFGGTKRSDFAADTEALLSRMQRFSRIWNAEFGKEAFADPSDLIMLTHNIHRTLILIHLLGVADAKPAEPEMVRAIQLYIVSGALGTFEIAMKEFQRAITEGLPLK